MFYKVDSLSSPKESSLLLSIPSLTCVSNFLRKMNGNVLSRETIMLCIGTFVVSVCRQMVHLRNNIVRTSVFIYFFFTILLFACSAGSLGEKKNN